MSVGYACLPVGVPGTGLRSCMLKNASEAKLAELIALNLEALEHTIDYNIINEISLFRIGSNLIPFGSSPVNTLPWEEMFAPQLHRIGRKIQNSGMRVSMHPGHYTALSSPRAEVIAGAIEDLHYHNRLLDSLKLGRVHKIVLHIGGTYGDKRKAMDRFIGHCERLDDAMKHRLVLENDERSYSIGDVLEIGFILNLPVVFDTLHHAINPGNNRNNDVYWINQCRKTWCAGDGKQKIHYSQQDPLKQPGSHSATIRIGEFMNFYKNLEREDVDIMLEVKDKNLSAIKCRNCISLAEDTGALELEWRKYRYAILERSAADYQEIQRLLHRKSEDAAISFYRIIEVSLQRPAGMESFVDAAHHVWESLKESASVREKERFLKRIQDYRQGKTTLRAIKNFLYRMAVKYRQSSLLDSYYFVF
ncbi:MAG: UV DNA damage repair endonuclease UvsE [Dethiobacteria bacterium]